MPRRVQHTHGFHDPEAYVRALWQNEDTLDPAARLAAQPALFRAFATPSVKAAKSRARARYLAKRRLSPQEISAIRRAAAEKSRHVQRARRAA